jgi:hypothetical protein
MLINTWGEVFSASLQNLWWGFINFVPNLIIAIIVFIVGWVLGSIIGRAIEQVLTAIKLDSLFESAGAGQVMRKAGLTITVSGFIGALVKWFIIIVFLMTSLEIVGLTTVNDFLRQVVLSYLPNVIVAALILIAATVIADFMKRVIESAARAASVRSANFLGTIAKYAIWIFAFIIALSQLGIAPAFMQILFTGIIAMLALAGGLAFGLGGRDQATRTIDHLRAQTKE